MFQISKSMLLAAVWQLLLLGRSDALSSSTERIVGGKPSALVPYQVSVRLKYLDLQQFGLGHICGGSLITQRVVVTAAHCVADTKTSPLRYRSASEFRLVMGSVYLYQRTAYMYNVLHVYHNQNFNINTLINDVALFFMNGRVPSGLSSVHPIALNLYAQPAGTKCTVTGWGVTANGGQTLSSVLLSAVVPILSNAACSNAYYGINPTDMLCAGYLQTGGVDACQGDSGGPLVCNATLAGIVSSGTGCALIGYPGIYTNVSSYVSWIKQVNATLDYNLYRNAAAAWNYHWPLLLLAAWWAGANAIEL